VLTTFRRDGTGVPTAMSMAIEGDRGYMRTWSTSGKAKRLRRSPRATVAPSTATGTPTGPAVEVRARFVDGPTAERAGRLIAAKHPVLHGLAVPIAHRLTRREPVYLELVAARED
jgi:PPOX class probable F420-dependent enzyme